MLVILTVAAALWAHNGEVTNVQNVELSPEINLYRWSWLHWWEANRELYLEPEFQGRHTQDIDPVQYRELHERSCRALLEVLKNPNVVSRESAALALGRLGGPAVEDVIDKLRNVAESDPSELVRQNAIISIGLINAPDSESQLLQIQPASQTLLAARILALGFLDPPSKELRDRVREMMSDPSPVVRGAAYWVLAAQPDWIDEAMCIRVIRTEISPWLLMGMQIKLGMLNTGPGFSTLAEVIRAEVAVESWPAWQLLIVTKFEKSDLGGKAQGGSWLQSHRRLFKHDPTPVPAGEDATDFRRVPRRDGIEDMYLARLRTSAVIGAGHMTGNEKAVEAIRVLLAVKGSPYAQTPQSFAQISLAQIGTPECLAILAEELSDRQAGRRKQRVELDSPKRGFAAIGLGLYARPYHTAQGLTDRLGYERASEMLVERLLNSSETLEVRTACAVALGISGRTSNLKVLIGRYDELNRVSPLLGGYTLLARAMLGDRNLSGPVHEAMARKPDQDEMTDQLARRAAVLSLGVMGSRESIPELVRYYSSPYYINREVILALSLCEAQGVINEVLPVMLESNDVYEVAYMAEIVGRLLAKEPEKGLSRFLIGSNFTVKDGLLEPYRRMCNPFLYEYLIPQFGSKWY